MYGALNKDGTGVMSHEISRANEQENVNTDAISASGDEKKESISEKGEVALDPLPFYSQDPEGGEKEKYVARDLNVGEPFPIETLGPDEEYQLTIRSLVVGTGLGCIVAASNIYLGLKTGFTFGASLFGAILGFAIIKAMTRILPPKWGGYSFGPRENCTIQTSATAAGSLTGMFVAAIPAAYQLDLLSAQPIDDFWRLITFTAVSAYYGLFFAIPLRKFYILKQRLVFPSPTATAYTIRSLHTPGGERKAKMQARALMYSFAGAFVFVVINQYVPGILMDWHIFYWLYSWGWESALIVESWGWLIELTPAFFGAGMLSGMNASFSFFGGSFLCYAFIGPLIVHTGQAAGKAVEDAPSNYINFFSMNFDPNTTPLNKASPRYWGLWVGVLMMFSYSFAELAMNGPTIYRGIRSAALEIYDVARRRPVREFEGEIPDPCPKEDQVPTWAWTSGLFFSILFTCLVCCLQYHMNLGNVILAIVLAFVFAFIGVQTSGTTDTNPVGTVAKASQLVVGACIRGQNKSYNAGLLENLLAGSIASSAASHSVDMVGDLKTGHLVRAKPKNQFWAQCFGSFFAIFLSVGLFVLFVKAYPCIIDSKLADECPFGAPSVAAWKAVSVAVISPKLPISLSCGMTAIGFAILAALTVVIKYLWIPAKYHVWVPNWAAVGLGFVVPQTYYPIAMCFGAVFSLVWQKKRPEAFDTFAFAVAAGLVAGEGIAGVWNAVATIAGFDGGKYGVTTGLPPW
ncbi:OPT superfamily oligopeptide transporter [Violaceomyces palustris]|uniref:OPT superfamily oligopeptide transporter n=1 Tax=Violaceomyces palustris TaxID=1673888 RepID=A0ACD0P7E1_9BASI|nr:OPT superfamily oligopeptide transporter [Violaceomyces palustris]